MKEQIKKILDIADKTYYNWKNENIPIVAFLIKYFSEDELQEFLETGKIEKQELIKNLSLTDLQNIEVFKEQLILNEIENKKQELLALEKKLMDSRNQNPSKLNLSKNDLEIKSLTEQLIEIKPRYKPLSIDEYNSKLFQKIDNKEELENKYIEFLKLELNTAKSLSSQPNINDVTEEDNSLKI